MNQISELKYQYSSNLFRQLIFQQLLTKDTVLVFFFVPSYQEKDKLSEFSLRVKGTLRDFTRSSLMSLCSQNLDTILEKDLLFLRGIGSHKCYCLQMPLTFSNLELLEDFSLTKKVMSLNFVFYNGIFLPSILNTLFLLKRLPFVSNLLVVIYFSLKLALLKLLGRFALLNLKRIS